MPWFHVQLLLFVLLCRRSERGVVATVQRSETDERRGVRRGVRQRLRHVAVV